MPGRRTRIKRARAWVWMYRQVFEVKDGEDERTANTEDDGSSCGSVDDGSTEQ